MVDFVFNGMYMSLPTDCLELQDVDAPEEADSLPFRKPRMLRHRDPLTA